MAFLLLPLSVWAMTPISDSDLSNVTGQAGVNINVDLLMNVRLGTMAWGDSDGIALLADGPSGRKRMELPPFPLPMTAVMWGSRLQPHQPQDQGQGHE